MLLSSSVNSSFRISWAAVRSWLIAVMPAAGIRASPLSEQRLQRVSRRACKSKCIPAHGWNHHLSHGSEKHPWGRETCDLCFAVLALWFYEKDLPNLGEGRIRGGKLRNALIEGFQCIVTKISNMIFLYLWVGRQLGLSKPERSCVWRCLAGKDEASRYQSEGKSGDETWLGPKGQRGAGHHLFLVRY